MVAEALGLVAQDGTHDAAGVKADPVGGHLAEGHTVVVIAEHVRKVLVKGPS